MKAPQSFRFALAALLLAGTFAARAADPLTYIPKQAEVVVGINARTLIDSEYFQKAISLHPEVNAQIEIMKNLAGVNPLQDINKFVFFGLMDNKNEGGFIFQGKFDEQKVLTLIKANPQYQETTIGGQTVHEWYETKEGKMKYGALLPDGSAVVWNSKATAEASIAGMQDPAQSYAQSPDAKLVPADADKATSWIIIANHLNKGPMAKFKVESISGSANLTPDGIHTHLVFTPADAADAPKWFDVGKGILAAAQLQPDNAVIRALANMSKGELSPDGKSVSWSTVIPKDKIMSVIEKKAAPKKK